MKHTLVQGSKGLQGLSGDFPVLPGRDPRHPGEEPEKFNPDIRYRGSLQNYLIEFPFYDDPKQQIESDYAPDAVKDLSELAQAFADDYPTQKLILKWIDGEAEHMAWEAQYLHFIEKLGYENFLIAMM